MEFGVWSGEFGVGSLEWGVWSLEWGVWSGELGVWSFDFPISRLADTGLDAQCESLERDKSRDLPNGSQGQGEH